MHAMLGKLGFLTQIRPHSFDIAYRNRGPAHDLRVPQATEAYEALMRETFPEHAGGIRDLSATLQEIDGEDTEEMSPEAFASMDLTLQELVEQHVDDERVLGVFAPLWGYIGLPPSKLSAFTYAITAAMLWNSFHRGGCFHIRGGGQALSDAFVD